MPASLYADSQGSEARGLQGEYIPNIARSFPRGTKVGLRRPYGLDFKVWGCGVLAQPRGLIVNPEAQAKLGEFYLCCACALRPHGKLKP